MAKKQKITMEALFAGILGSVVENISLDDALKKVKLSQKQILNQWVAPQNSTVAVNYVKEVMVEKYASASREDGSDLYLVKKVLCSPDEYEEMAEAVSEEDTDKYKVVRLIGSNPLVMHYKQELAGIEAYLVSGKTPIEALRKTSSEDPIFKYNHTDFNAADAEQIDEFISDAIYNHSPESMVKMFEVMGAI